MAPHKHPPTPRNFTDLITAFAQFVETHQKQLPGVDGKQLTLMAKAQAADKAAEVEARTRHALARGALAESQASRLAAYHDGMRLASLLLRKHPELLPALDELRPARRRAKARTETPSAPPAAPTK